jgi:hypothetical protein
LTRCWRSATNRYAQVPRQVRRVPPPRPHRAAGHALAGSRRPILRRSAVARRRRGEAEW